jgi:hypothetical protein
VTKTSPCWNGDIVPGIDVEVRIELEHRDAQSALDEQASERRRGDALTERRHDAAR